MQQLSPAKWRPSLAQVVASVFALLLCLPIAGLLLLNFYSKQLVQQTEESLIAQAAVLSAQFSEMFVQAGGDPRIGHLMPRELWPDPDNRYRPVLPSLYPHSAAILPPRADGQPAIRPPHPVFARIGTALSATAERAQNRTLAAYQIIDPFGRVIGGTGEVGYSFAHVPEVARALSGHPASVLRYRAPVTPLPPVWSISRRSDMRVFFALPVTVDTRVIGAIYVSRTPGNVFEFAYRERRILLQAGLFVVLASLLIGFVFWRFITRPLYGLIDTSERIAERGRPSIVPLDHYGTREVAQLGNSFLRMADTVHRHADATQTFTRHVTHELKTPITAILGAVELLQDQGDTMSVAQRQRFLDNIAQDGARMNRLLADLRHLAAAKQDTGAARADLPTSVQEIASRFDNLQIRQQGAPAPLPLSQDNLTIVLAHLAENAAQHGAQMLEIAQSPDGRTLTIRDDGTGISPENRSRVFDPFFTTRQTSGGTGMGLSIVAEIIRAAGGDIALVPSQTGAVFDIRFP